ncbi:MAG: PaaI family thioesterase [Desulfomonile tiedjei]|nr:PaaI family thioesterase [Desulfomonile tiedjei]
MKPIPNPYQTGKCFFCGEHNPIGLKLAFHETETEPKELVLQWEASPLYAGFGRILHGGIQSGLFDEIMGWTTNHFTGQMGVTTDLNVQFLKPVYVEQRIEVRCRIESRDGDKIHLAAEINDQRGLTCTKGTGTYYLIDRERFDNLVEPIEP